MITSVFPEITRNAIENIIRYSSIVAGTFYHYYLRENKQSHIKEKTRIKQFFSVSNIFNLRVYSFRIVLVKYEASNCRCYMDGRVSRYIDLYIIV